MNKLLIMKLLAAMFAPISCIPFGEEKCFLPDLNQRPFIQHPLALLSELSGMIYWMARNYVQIQMFL